MLCPYEGPFAQQDSTSIFASSTPDVLPFCAMAIRSLCITAGADIPTVATFIGMHRSGIDLTVVCPNDHPNCKVLTKAGVSTIDIRLNKNFDRVGIRALRNELERGDYHIMHSFNSRALTNGLRACKGLPIKIVAYRGIVGNVSYLDPMSWMRYLNPRIDRIVCVCEAIRQYFLQMQPAFLRMPPTRPVTIHKGHKLEWYTDTPEDLSSVSIPGSAFVIGCAASYRPRKGVEFLIEAMEKLPNEIPAYLLLIGHMDAARLTARISQSPVRERIHRIGFQSNAPAFSAACDVFCLPSTKREGLPRAVIEAMAYSVPPVVTNSGGSPELVVDGESGLVVPIKDSQALADAFERLYRDPDLRRDMGRAARQRIAQVFRNEDTVVKTIKMYEDLLAA